MKPTPLRLPKIFLTLFVVIAYQNAPAQWSMNPAVNNAISTGAGFRSAPNITSDGAGGSIMVWYDTRNGNADIYAQRISGAGAVQWTTNGVAVRTGAGDQGNNVIISDGSGGAFIAWQDENGGVYDLYAQRIDASGTLQWAANGVAICTALGYQAIPSMISDGAGGAILMWRDGRGSDLDIYAQRINGSGVVQWDTNGVVVCSATETQDGPVMIPDGSGGAIASWVDGRGSTNGIYAQRINASGAALWTANGIAVCSEKDASYGNSVVSDGAGGAIVTWTDFRNGNDYDIYAQRINPSGVVQWTVDGVLVCGGASGQSNPLAVTDGSGGAIMTWWEYRSGNANIYAQRITTAGSISWTADGVAVCSAANEQSYPGIVTDGTGGAVIAWTDLRDLTTFNVFAQRINATGAAQWNTNGIVVTSATGDQRNVSIMTDENKSPIIAWSDTRSGYAIYAQRIDPNGDLYGLYPSFDHAGDIANDQGGKVRLFWRSSPLDVRGNTTVRSYTIKLGARSTGLFGKSSANTASGIYWQTAGSVTADWSDGYTTVVTTLADSGIQGAPYYYFQIIAHTADSSIFSASNIDSAYSIDNIPPVGVGGESIAITGSGNITLRWRKNKVDRDLMGYEVYRSPSSGFLLNSITKLAQTTDTSFTDPGAANGSGYYYRITAIDVHGNRSAATEELNESVLSFQLSSFTATMTMGSGVRLEWQTVTELNSYGFGIERRTEGTGWNEIGFVSGNGSSNASHSYSFADRQVPAGRTAYRLRQVSSSGESRYSLAIEVDLIPTTTALSQNYPNPFNPSTEISYQVSTASTIKLTVHDILGREVSTLVNEHQEPGLYQVRWDAAQLPSGIYLYRLQTGTTTLVKKMLLQK